MTRAPVPLWCAAPSIFRGALWLNWKCVITTGAGVGLKRIWLAPMSFLSKKHCMYFEPENGGGGGGAMTPTQDNYCRGAWGDESAALLCLSFRPLPGTWLVWPPTNQLLRWMHCFCTVGNHGDPPLLSVLWGKHEKDLCMTKFCIFCKTIIPRKVK